MLAVVLACGVSCGSDDDAEVVLLDPVFEVADCPVEVGDPEIVCGFVEVLENRSLADGNRVRLSVARLPATGPSPQDPPVMFFGGGPGAQVMAFLDSFAGSALRVDRELILFDQRGIGFSEPALECPEREEAVWEIFAQSSSVDAELDVMRRATVACRDRLVGRGIDLASYDTVENARDVADIRRALGLGEWNIFAGSYGTTLALQVMRSHADGLRSVVLDAAYPIDQGRSMDRHVETATRSIDLLIERCNADAICAESVGGDLALLIDEVVAEFDEHPFRTEVFDEANDRMRDIVLDGRDLVAGLFLALYDDDLIAALPSLIVSIRDGNEAILQQLVNLGLNSVNEPAEAMFLAVECRDRGGAWIESEVRQLLAERPEFTTIFNIMPTPVCDVLGLGSIAERDRGPVFSDVPTLVFSGEFDPVTPPSWGALVAERLDDAEFIELRNVGHGAAGASSCSFGLVTDFLRFPSRDLDRGCIGN